MASRAAVWLLIPIALATLRAQNPAQTLRTFRFTATDAKGQPVADLRPDEIRISDAGTRISVVFSRFLSAPSKRAALLPHEFANRVDGWNSASTLILLDLFNADFTGDSTACREIVRALGPMASPANVFLFLLRPDTSLFAIHGWSTPGPSPWTGQIGELLKQGLQTAGKHADSTGADTAANLTYQALKGLGTQYAALPGQKRLVWVTRKMPLLTYPTGFSGSVSQTLLQQLGAEFRQLGIPIYTVHEEDRGTERALRGRDWDSSLASLTGGRSFEDEATGRAIAEAQTDAAAMYLAGYHPVDADGDSKFHELRVSTTRKGVRILAPSGYTADPLKEIEQSALSLVESSAFDTQDIGLRASVDTAGSETHFRIQVEPGDLFVQGKVLLSFVYFSADGPQIATEPVSVSVNQINVDQTLPSGTSKVRIVVQDAATGITGSLSIPII